MEVHRARVVALLVEVDPVGVRAGLHIAGNTAVVGTVCAVDAADLRAQNALAVVELDAGLLGFGLGVGRRAVLRVGVQAVAAAAVHPRAVRTVGGDGDHLVQLLLPGDAGIPQRAAGGQLCALADARARIAGIERQEERHVHVVEHRALAQRVVVVRGNHVLHVRHFPHQVDVLVIVCAVQRVQINRHRIHGVQVVDARIVVRGALCDDHRAVPVGEIAVNLDGFLCGVRLRLVLAGKVLCLHLRLRVRVRVLEFFARLLIGGGHGHLLTNADEAADLDGVAVLEGAGLALGGGVLRVLHVLGVQVTVVVSVLNDLDAVADTEATLVVLHSAS